MMPKRKDFHTQCELYWRWYWDEFPVKVIIGFHPWLVNCPESKQNRKLKKEVFYPHEYNFNLRCPKHHNKLHHIRPKRRETRLLEKEILRALDPEEAEIKHYVNHKEHVYWS